MTAEVRAWALGNFGGADLKDARRSKRLVQVSEALANHPQSAIPQACKSWGDAKAAYRLLNEEDVTPDAIQQPHRTLTHRQCAAHRLVLVLQDSSDLDYTFRKMKGRGKIGDGRGRGLIQHTALAVEPAHGAAIGLLHQSWHRRVERDPQETDEQRLARWRESDIWAETIEAVGPGPAGCLFVHVMDSHGDCFNTFAAARRAQAGLLARVMHYGRKLEDGTPLLEHLEGAAVAGDVAVTLHEQRDERNRIKHAQRSARLAARVASVVLPPTDTVRGEEAPIRLNAILLRETDVPEGEEAVRWVLLTDLPCDSIEAVREVVRYYALRWRIEELHRVEKEGCRVEDAQFDDAADVMRLASIKCVIAVRLLQLRDAAQAAEREPALDTPERLQQIAPSSWIAVVGKLAKKEPARLTVRQFYRQIAKRGGWLGRKCDGPPGWKTLWRGWNELWWMVVGYELASGQRRSG